MAEEEQNLNKESGFWEVAVSTILILALLGVVALLYWGGLKLRAEMYHAKAAQEFSRGNINEAQKLETNAVNLASFEDRYHRGLSQIYLSKISRVVNNKELSQGEKRKQIQDLVSRIVTHTERATKISDKNIANWSSQGFVYQTLMNYAVKDADKQAVRSYEKALELAPTNPRIYTQLGRVYISRADIATRAKNSELKKQHLNEAEKYLKDALNLKPNYIAARFQLAMVYWRENNMDKAKREFQNTVAINPKHADARYFLGLIHDQQGNKEKAIAQFKEIASLSERNKKQMNKIIERINAGEPALGEEIQLPDEAEEAPELEGATTTPASATSTATTTIPEE